MASPGNYTGKMKEKLQKEAQQEQERRAAEVSMITAQEKQVKDDTVVDYTEAQKGRKKKAVKEAVVEEPPTDQTSAEDESPSSPEVQQNPGVQEVEPVEPIQVSKTKVKVRARANLENVTIGAGTMFDFEAGRQYLVTPNVAQHLAERELVDVLG